MVILHNNYIATEIQLQFEEECSIMPTKEELIEKLKDKNQSLINIYYGEDVKPQDAEQLRLDVAEIYPDCDVELYDGGRTRPHISARLSRYEKGGQFNRGSEQSIRSD